AWHTGTTCHRRTRSRSWCPRHRGADRGPGSQSRVRRRDVPRPPADGGILSVYSVVEVLRCPAGRIDEESYGADAPVCAEIEPMASAGRNTQQVSRLDLDGVYRRVRRPNEEKARSVQDEPYFVLGVRMLLVELREHGVESWCAGPHVDNVSGHVTAGFFQPLDFWRVRLQHSGGVSAWRDA